MRKIYGINNFYHPQTSTNAPQKLHVMPMLHVTTQKDLTLANATLDSVVMALHAKVGFLIKRQDIHFPVSTILNELNTQKY